MYFLHYIPWKYSNLAYLSNFNNFKFLIKYTISIFLFPQKPKIAKLARVWLKNVFCVPSVVNNVCYFNLFLQTNKQFTKLQKTKPIKLQINNYRFLRRAILSPKLHLHYHFG
jgi:hypothetical protein